MIRVPRVALAIAALAWAGPASAQLGPTSEGGAVEPAQATPDIDVGRLYRELRSSFVVIRCSGERYGTGFGFGRVGRVATARHVVDCPRNLAAELEDGTVASVRVVAVSEEHDLALLELEGGAATRVPPLIASEETPPIGEQVVSVGFPVGPETDGPHELAVTRGIVAQRTANRIVHDALVSPGSSGGPVLDRGGRVVGVTFAVPRGSSVALAVPVDALLELSRTTAREAGDPRSPLRFAFDVGLDYEVADVQPFHFAGAELALSMSILDQAIVTLRAIALLRLPRTDDGVRREGARFAAELDAGYRLRLDGFPVLFELAGGLSMGNDHVDLVRQELMLEDPSCDPATGPCAVRIVEVGTGEDHLLARPLLTLRATLGPLTLAYTVLFDVERVEATAHRVTLRLGLF